MKSEKPKMKEIVVKAKDYENVFTLHLKKHNGKKAGCCNWETDEMFSLDKKNWLCRDCMMQFLYSEKARIIVCE